MISKLFRILVPVVSFLILFTPMVPHAYGAGEVFTFTPLPTRQQETGTAAESLVLNVSRATIGTVYQFTMVVTDPSGMATNRQNQTVATSASFLFTLQYPRDFSTSIIFAGNYTVVTNENLPAIVPNVASGQFQVGLTDKLTYQRTNTVSIKAAGYRNLESTTINIFQGSTSTTGYPRTITADPTGQLSTSWQIPVNAASSSWTVSLTGSQTSKIVPDRQAFNVYPIDVAISPLSLGQVTIQRTQTQSVSFTVSYSTGGVVQTGSAKIRLTQPDGVASAFTTAVYNSTYASYRATYIIPAGSQKGNWLAAIDQGMFNDSYGNTGPAASIVRPFTVYPTNVTITQITVAQSVLQRTQSQYYSFGVSYLSGLPVQTGSTNIRITQPDGTTSFTIVANYNSSTGLYQAVSKMPINAPIGAWVASIDPNSFNDGYGNGGPLTSVVRGFTVQAATFNIILSIPNQTYTIGQVIPIYAVITNPNGTIFTSGTVTVTFSSNGSQTGSPLSLVYVQGQSRWAGSYVVGSADPSGLWVTTVKVMDAYGNTGQQTQSVIVSTSPAHPPPATPQSLTFWFLLAALLAGSGGSSLLLLRRFNTTQGSFDELFKLTAGEFSPSTTLLILGDAGSGTTTLSLELIYRQLSKGEHAALITYDAFPSEIQRAMKSFGWEVDGYLRNGSFRILDCYSALAGVEKPEIRDPVDFTETGIQVSSMIENAKGGPVMIVMDSIAPIFNGVQAQTTINFLRTISAKIKNNNGILVLVGARGSIPEEVRSIVDHLVDGVLELSNIRKGASTVRLLAVKRLAGRKTSPVPAEFEIITGKGIVFVKPRIPLKILTTNRQTS